MIPKEWKRLAEISVPTACALQRTEGKTGCVGRGQNAQWARAGE